MFSSSAVPAARPDLQVVCGVMRENKAESSRWCPAGSKEWGMCEWDMEGHE